MLKMTEWMKQLAVSENNEGFSELCHNYYKLATMRVMQEIREQYSVPPEDIPTLTLAIFARFLNESCYAVGAAIKNGMRLDQILDDRQRDTLLRILSGAPLDPLDRDDIEVDIQKSLAAFRVFIKQKGPGFYD